MRRWLLRFDTPFGWLVATILLVAVALAMAVTADARVISYAPVTDRAAIATFHHRDTRHFALIENTRGYEEVVLHDTTGADAPRILYPTPGSSRLVAWVALWEDERNVPAVLIALRNAGNAPARFVFSNDAGVTWNQTQLPPSTFVAAPNRWADNGGPFTRGRFAPVRIGNSDYPFVVYDAGGAVWRVSRSGLAERWVDADARAGRIALLGSDLSGTRHLVRQSDGTLLIAAFDGRQSRIPWPELDFATGWIGSDGSVYLETSEVDFIGNPRRSAAHSLWLYRLGEWKLVVAPARHGNTFAIPTHDYSGAWVIDRVPGAYTDLLRYTHAAGLQTMWSDRSAPAVEALHAGVSGNTLLLVTHVERPDLIPSDPRLAVWRVGWPAPTVYDELYLYERENAGFVHLEVDRAAQGEPFVYDSGGDLSERPISTTSAGGGSDVLRDYSVVRGSLRQRLVLPGVGHAAGANGSNWATDVTLYNASGIAQMIELRYVDERGSETRNVPLHAHGIVVIADVVGALFGRTGTGTLFITPQGSVNVTSRTYTTSGGRTYGYAMPAIEVHAAGSARFPLVFSTAFPGSTFRKSITLVDAGGTGAEVDVNDAIYRIPPSGQIRIVPRDAGGYIVRPRRGFVVGAAFAVENETNDAMWIPPGPTFGWIPILEANGDISVFNPTADVRPVHFFVALSVDSYQRSSVNLFPYESRLLKDAHSELFVRSGTSSTFDVWNGVRTVVRNYRKTPTGATYGYLVPPHNRLQLAAAGDSLEILGAIAGAGRTTTLGIVPTEDAPYVRVQIFGAYGGTVSDSFVPRITGGFTKANLLADLPPGPVRIRLTPSEGSITAYATMTESASNDAVYLAPYLAAKE